MTAAPTPTSALHPATRDAGAGGTTSSHTSAGWHTHAATACTIAVVVHYHSAEHTAACAASLRQHAPTTPVIVVDNDGNAEPNPSLTELCTTHPDHPLAIVAAGYNGGFGAGCNIGIERALGAAPDLAHVLLLNPDARVAAGCLEHLIATAASHPDAGIVGGRVLSADGTSVQFENGRLRPWTLTRMHRSAPRRDGPFPTTFITGALMLVDAGMLRDGLRFDEGYFLYVEDLDLCSEVRARGRTLWIDPRAVITHTGGGTVERSPSDPETGHPGLSDEQLYWMARSKVRFGYQRLSRLQRYSHLMLAVLCKPLVACIKQRSTRAARAHLRGIRDGWRDRRGQPFKSPR